MLKTTLSLCILMVVAIAAHSQGMKVTEVLNISKPELKKDITPEAFQTFITQEASPQLTQKKPGTSYHLFKADRGNRKGQFLLVSGIEKTKGRNPVSKSNPFNWILTVN